MEMDFLLFVIVGFFAQTIDGCLGMAYGVSSTSFLLSLGVPPAAASAGVHIAEVFTTFASGISHWKFGNVDKKLVKQLLLPGVIGGIAGAYILTSIPGDVIKPYIAAYLLLMGVTILYKVVIRKPAQSQAKQRYLTPLATFGGFCDAVGGGGWGPIVTSTLIVRGGKARSVIGSVNLTEFFVTFAEAATFIVLIGIGSWKVVGGLILGGVLAAPVAAFMCQKLPEKGLIAAVGIVITILSLRTVCNSFGMPFIF